MNGSFELRTIGGLDVLICSPLAGLGIPHAFTLRWRRVDEPIMSSGAGIAFGLPGQQSADWNDLSPALGLMLVPMRQVHGAEVEVALPGHRHPPVCDGLLTDAQGMGLMVQTADCVPLLMWDEGRNVVAAVHAGWRGTLAGVAQRAVRGLREHFGSQPEELHAAMGPSIGPCCYEVGDEVVRAFAERMTDFQDVFAPGCRGRKRLDLVKANRTQLTASGVPSRQIYPSDLCTFCNNELLYSYRKEGKGVGRLMAVIGVASS